MATIRQKIIEFDNAREAFRDYGARDSEPDGVFQRLLYDIFEGTSPAIPRTPEKWQLFADMPGASVAAKTLCSIATDIAYAIENLPLKSRRELQEFLEDYCWRLF